jgi:hypothetical protein
MRLRISVSSGSGALKRNGRIAAEFIAVLFPKREDQLAHWACSHRATVEATAIDVEPLLLSVSDGLVDCHYPMPLASRRALARLLLVQFPVIDRNAVYASISGRQEDG